MTFTDNAPEPARRPTSIWLKVLGIGCGGVLVILLILAGLVASNWPKLTGYYQQTKSTFSDMMIVQAALQKKYAATVRIMARRESSVQGSILTVTLLNPALMDRINVDGPNGRQAALEVALTARDTLPPAGRYDNYEIVFQRERGSAGASVSGSWSFRFTAADLPAEKSSRPADR